MREELRDYRFYKEDLAHPTAQAVAHIMEKFLPIPHHRGLPHVTDPGYGYEVNSSTDL